MIFLPVVMRLVLTWLCWVLATSCLLRKMLQVLQYPMLLLLINWFGLRWKNVSFCSSFWSCENSYSQGINSWSKWSLRDYSHVYYKEDFVWRDYQNIDPLKLLELPHPNLLFLIVKKMQLMYIILKVFISGVDDVNDEIDEVASGNDCATSFLWFSLLLYSWLDLFSIFWLCFYWLAILVLGWLFLRK